MYQSIPEPISPLDALPPPPGRQTQSNEFFSAVYLDSPTLGRFEGGTRPLRVVKKRAKVIVATGRRSRRSVLSVPQSPGSNFDFGARPVRTNTTSSTSSNPHLAISRAFLALSPPADSPRLPPAKAELAELHLNLSKGSYDESAIPGPSPPMSPSPSVTKRTFIAPPKHLTYYRSKALPPSPLTPSRAPPKAAKLLGAAPPLPVLPAHQGKKRDHFRPLPSQTLTEIERFFGNTPAKKPRTKPSGGGLADRKVAEGSTVKHKGEDGTMWIDLEEEQEFAWLMSEVFALKTNPLPPSPCALPSADVMWEEASDEENQWEMNRFTSVLTAQAKPVKAKKAKPAVGDSFMELGPDTPMGDNHAAQSSGLPTSSDEGRPPSPPRIRNRPPPLTLRVQARNPKLPLVSTTPSTSHTLGPTTPFTKPRRAPIPGYQPEVVPSIPSLPCSPEEISFFEPATPIEEKPKHRRVLSGGTSAAAVANKGVKNGGAWLKKVVRPLAGGVRV